MRRLRPALREHLQSIIGRQIWLFLFIATLLQVVLGSLLCRELGRSAKKSQSD
jgi:hypothetical protein